MKSHPYIRKINRLSPARMAGYVTKISTGHVEATGPFCTIGDICEIENSASAPNIHNNQAKVLAEVASVDEKKTVLIPFEQTASISPDAKVVALPQRNRVPVGDAFAGRLVNALAMPIDGEGEIIEGATAPIMGEVLKPLDRRDADTTLQTGIRAIDGALTIGRGQRLGIFAASGVGKTTLLHQLAMQVECDRCVICLVGERGREVEFFWRSLSKSDAKDCLTCVVATSDKSAVLRARAVHQALALCEYWRAQGEHVLLLVDSVTRYAMALREIGLAANAPPTLRAYTPNVFAALPRLVERCGASQDGGAITCIMTVLSETDDVDDPIVEVMKSLLDGHIVLSRQLAEQGHYPAIDITKSISRQSERLMNSAHAKAAQALIANLSTYEEARVMIDSGIYKSGSNEKIDTAIVKKQAITKFLRQRPDQNVAGNDTVGALQKIFSGASQ